MVNALGFDLGSHSLKLVETSFDGKKHRAVKIKQFAHPFGTMISPDVEQTKQMATMIKQVLTEQKFTTQNIRAAIPESMVSTKIVSTPPLTDAELASAIDWLAEQHIAIPLEELKLEYEVLYRPDRSSKNENMRIMLIGVPKTVIENYLRLFEFLEFEPMILETQVMSGLRSLLVPDLPTTLVVHMGAASTDFYIIHMGEVVFVYSFGNGGRLLSRSIEKGLNVDMKQAEEYKMQYGVDPQFLEGKLVNILQPVLQLFRTEILKAMQFFTNQYGTQTVKRIVLSGGQAHMPGLMPYFTSQLNVECILARPFERLTIDSSLQVPADREAAFTVATGLAIRTQ